jgi:hypothetical protein
MTFGDDYDSQGTSYLVAGVALCLASEDEPTQGRVIVFEVRDKALVRVGQLPVAGGVYALASLRGNIVASIGSIILYIKATPKHDEGGTYKLEIGVFVCCARSLLNIVSYLFFLAVCNHTGHIVATSLDVFGDFVLVGDILRSITLLVFDGASNRLQERAYDASPHEMSALAILGADTYVGAEVHRNLFTCRYHPGVSTMEVTGEYHLGEFVNRIFPGKCFFACAPRVYQQLITLGQAPWSTAASLMPTPPWDTWYRVNSARTTMHGYFCLSIRSLFPVLVCHSVRTRRRAFAAAAVGVSCSFPGVSRHGPQQ